jgi:hypothetical protein
VCAIRSPRLNSSNEHPRGTRGEAQLHVYGSIYRHQYQDPRPQQIRHPVPRNVSTTALGRTTTVELLNEVISRRLRFAAHAWSWLIGSYYFLGGFFGLGHDRGHDSVDELYYASSRGCNSQRIVKLFLRGDGIRECVCGGQF